MIEIIVTVYALAYVLMEFIILNTADFKLPYFEELAHPVNWYDAKQATFTFLGLVVFLPVTSLVILMIVIADRDK